MQSALEPRAGTTVIGLFLGSLAITGAVALVTAPITPRLAVAQTVGNPNDQPTARTLPPGTSTLKGSKGAADRPTGTVRPASAISPNTAIVPDAKSGNGRVDPLDHLPPNDRRGSGRS